MTVGEALKQLRLHAGLTQEQMAAGIVSESFYSKVERDIHDIDTKVLMDILTVHRFNVIEFFGKIWNQPTPKNPDFDLVAQISDAQNKKDLGKLNEITAKIQNGGDKIPLYVQIKLESAYAWITHSNQHASPQFKRHIKSIMLDKNWTQSSYNYLSQAVIFLDIDDAYYLVNSAFRSYEKNPKYDTFTIQFVANIAVNFLNCCYHKNAKKEYVDRAVNFLRNSLPKDGAIGISSVLGTYYEALFNNDKEMAKMVIKVLDKSGYLSLIQDTLDPQTLNSKYKES